MRNKIRQGKPTTSFKQKDENANFDIFEHKPSNRKKVVRKSYAPKPKPLWDKAERNKMLRDLCIKKKVD